MAVPASRGQRMVTFQMRICQAVTRPLRTYGSLATKSSITERSLGDEHEHGTSTGSARAPAIRRAPCSRVSSINARCACRKGARRSTMSSTSSYLSNEYMTRYFQVGNAAPVVGPGAEIRGLAGWPG